MDSQAFTLFHVAISLIAILCGLVVLYGLLTSNRMRGMTLLFLATTVATSVTGYFFHRSHILPSHIVGAISLAFLCTAIIAFYTFRLRGVWRVTYVVSAVASLYLNIFVLIAQAFGKVPFLHALAPQGTEAPFLIAQAVVLVGFIILGFLAVGRFRPRPV